MIGSTGPLLMCALAVAGLLLAEARESQAGIWLAKPLASMAFVWAGLASGALGSGFGRLLLLGLLLCLVGDLLLIPRGRPAVFRAGIVAFLLGHLAYSAAFLTRPLAPLGLVVGGLLMLALLYGVARWLGPRLPSDMVWPVRAYLVVIGIMAMLAVGASGAGSPLAIAVGALAFAASDVAVARDRFVTHAFANRAWGLPLYYLAQWLLASTPAGVR
jgi:uncharacterized membrane protein YhhN